MTDEKERIKCQHENCTEEGTPCFFPDNETETPDEYFCTEHAFDQGYCYLCGQFFSGIERFDFPETYGGIRGLCESCDDEIKTELEEYDEEEEYVCVDDEVGIFVFNPEETEAYEAYYVDRYS